MNLNKIPATVVTGFLGSGKTTLLSNLLKQANGKRIAVIVNEFGELDIDANLLRSCPLECDESEESESQNGIYELANGCICCTVEEEFLPVMEQLVERRDDIDHILIETSGLALPKPLVQAFNWPNIKQHCTVDAVVTLVDGPAILAGRHAHNEDAVQAQRLADDSLDHDPTLQELLDDQLSAADIVVMGKSDLLNAQEQKTVEAILAQSLPNPVKVIKANCEQNLSELPNVLMGLESASEDQIEQVHTHHDHHHDHGEHHEHAHDHFDSFVVKLGVADSESLVNEIQALVSEHAIYRIKGFIAQPNKPMRQVIQVVGDRIQTHFDRLWGDETPATSLVVIGRNLPQSDIEKRLNKAAVPTDESASVSVEVD